MQAAEGVCTQGVLLISEIENRDERSNIKEHVTDIQLSPSVRIQNSRIL